MAVDTLGLLWALVVTPASVQDGEGAKQVLAQFQRQVKRPKVIWVDAAYRSVVQWAREAWGWVVQVIVAAKGQKGFAVQPKRWIVERTFGWWNRWRRLAKDYERTTESSQAFIQIGMIHLMTKRLTRKLPF